MPFYTSTTSRYSPFSPGLQHDLDWIVTNGVGRLIATSIETLVRAAKDTLAEGEMEILRRTRGMSGITRQINSKTEDVLMEVGTMAQKSIVKSYDQLVTRQEGAADRSHYRAGAGRLAGGVLRDALASENFLYVGPDSLDIGPISFLNRAAAQWHRIAFGAGERGASGAGTRAVAVRWGDIDFGTLTVDEGPSPGFAMPSGGWFGTGIVPGDLKHVKASKKSMADEYPSDASRRGFDRFYPGVGGAGAGHWIPTKGIRGKDFFGAGLVTIGRELPQAMETLINDSFDNWIRKSFGNEIATVTERVYLA